MSTNTKTSKKLRARSQAGLQMALLLNATNPANQRDIEASAAQARVIAANDEDNRSAADIITETQAWNASLCTVGFLVELEL